MADFRSIAAVGSTLERYLNDRFAQQQPIDAINPTTASLVRTEDLSLAGSTGSVLAIPGLSIYLYRVEVNSAVRASWSAYGSERGSSHLALDLHYLLTPWGANAQHEHLILGRTLQVLDEMPSFTGPLLHPSALWEPGESVQFRMAEMSTVDVMETFDSLPVDFRVSVPYVASVVRVDGQGSPVGRDVDTAYIGIKPEVEVEPEYVAP